MELVSKIAKVQINSSTGNYNVYYIPTTKFKTIITGVIFSRPLKQEFIAERALLALMLTKTNHKYPNEQKLSTHLDDLYNINLSGYVNRIGRITNLTFLTNIINSDYIFDNVDLLKESIILLNDTINNPYFVNGFFDENIIIKEKKLLIDDLKSVYNNKALYANLKLIEIMFKDELFSLNVNGAIEAVEAVTKESLKAAYYEMLKSETSVFMIGDINELKIKNAMNGNLALTNTFHERLSFIDTETKEVKEVVEITESQKINQSTLCLGYRVDIRYNDPLYYPMVIFNGMFGRFFHSELSQVIREEHGLAYYINSDYASRKGVVVITSGINADDYLKVVTLINQVLTKFIEGELSDENLDLTKKAIINGILASSDSQIGLLKDILAEIENPNGNLTIEERMAKVNNVKKEEIIICSKMMRLDTIFFLKGSMEGVNHEETL